MAKTPTYDPQTSEARSDFLAGLTEACNKISGILNMNVKTFEDLTLPELYISENDRFRFYQAPFGSKLWLQVPAPVIKKNGIEISPDRDGFEINYLGGSITFAKNTRLTADDVITASATCISDTSQTISEILSNVNSISTKANKFKGSFSTFDALHSQYPTGSDGDYAIIQSETAIYIWDTTAKEWVKSYQDTDLSDYYTIDETDDLLDKKENSITAQGTSPSSDGYYYGGRKSWVELSPKVLATLLTDLSKDDSSEITSADSILSALGKIQAQISKQLHPITGTSTPTTTLAGIIGQDYVDISSGKKYHLVSIENADSTPSYIWEEYSNASDLNAAKTELKGYTDTSIQTAVLNSWAESY